MKVNYFLTNTLIAIFLVSSFVATAQKDRKSNKVDTLDYAFSTDEGRIEISFMKGKSFNHPTFAIWVEDLDGNYIQSLFVTQYFATGIFGNADAGNGIWSSEAGESLRPAALPYWSHQRNILSRDSLYVPTPENPVTDAVTGATPTNSFYLAVPISLQSQAKFKVLFEINQAWDWNNYWTNNKYPDDMNYKSSAQPSLVYEAQLDWNNSGLMTEMKAIGHGHYSGKDGSLTTDLSTLSTALSIAKHIQIKLVD